MAKNTLVAEKKNINKPNNKVGLKRKKIQKNLDVVKVKKPKTTDYSSMSIDDFMNNELDRSSDEENEKAIESNLSISKNDESQSDLDSDNENINEFESHKESLAKLKDTDPEFYKFLQENDKKLLQFNQSDSEDEDDENQLHKPTEKLEVASDESDFEPDDDTAVNVDNRVITLKLLKTWQKDIQTDTSSKTLNCLMKAFQAALVRVSNDDSVITNYKVDGSAVFNAVVQLCVLELGPALRRYLKLPEGSKQLASKSKRFVKIKSHLRGYFQDLLKLMSGVSSTNIRNVLLKHLHYMTPFLVCFTNVTKKLLKKLIHLWGTAEESVRVISFLVILRITNNHQTEYLDIVLKAMYMTYVKNSKFMSSNTLPEINFMRRSLTEIFTLDINVSYQHVFLYIRQLAINLRTAVTVHKKENLTAVLNWQFINSIHLWANLLTVTVNKPQLQPLIYPLVQVTLGVIKLIPTAQYFPLRFNCLRILIELSRDTGIFIPILPFLVEVLATFDFNKKHKKVSMKPMQFSCILRVPKSQMIENSFKDVIVETLYSLLLEYLTSQSHTISFPDLTLFCVIQFLSKLYVIKLETTVGDLREEELYKANGSILYKSIKQFLKKCSIANYTKKFKQILEKIEQNTKFIENERKKVNFNIQDFKRIEAWEVQIKNKGTPLATFYESWHKIHSVKKRKQATKNEEIADYALPQLKKIDKIKKKSEGPVELFPSDSEDDQLDIEKNNSDSEETEIKEESDEESEQNEKTQMKEEIIEETKQEELSDNDDQEQDEVKDIDLNDW